MTPDTIFALSSGRPPSGVAVVRVSGPQVRTTCETIIGSVPEPRRATLATMRAADGSAIDRGIILFFPGPASFTGEDVAEFQVHGGPAVVAAVLDRLGRLPGLRPAEAGDFTRRAFLNGHLDLTEVEGLADLTAAETEAQRRQAIRQASGALRSAAETWRQALVGARALIEAELDFADEDDVPEAVSDRAWDAVRMVRAAIAAALDEAHGGERLRDGAEVVILGPVNVGKSSLLNALARRDVAIVSDEPGTTRDLVAVRLDVAGYPLTVVDTAGLRAAAGSVEKEGIRRARLRAEAADLLLAAADATGPVEDAMAMPPDVPVLRIGTKADLLSGAEVRAAAGARFDILLSSVTGEGFDDLVAALERFARDRLSPGESALVTRARHRAALVACDAALAAALSGLPLELRAEELRRATDALGRLAGRVDVEDLLDVIFRDFCIGK